MKCSNREIINNIWENLISASLSLGSTPFGETHEDNDIKWVNTGRVFCNRVFSIQIDKNNVTNAIERVLEEFKTLNMPFMWINSPFIPSESVSLQLKDRGIVFARSWSGMAMEIEDFTETSNLSGICISEANTENIMKEWNIVRSDGFNSPRQYLGDSLDVFTSLKAEATGSWTHYIAYKDGTAASSCSLYVDGEIAGLYWVATLSEFRGIGIASLLVRHALLKARIRGCKLAILQASEMGKGVYEKIGFKEYCKIDLYNWKP